MSFIDLKLGVIALLVYQNEVQVNLPVHNADGWQHNCHWCLHF